MTTHVLSLSRKGFFFLFLNIHIYFNLCFSSGVLKEHKYINTFFSIFDVDTLLTGN